MRTRPLMAGAAAVLLLAALPVGAAGQRCHVDSTPGHDDWHAKARVEQALRDTLEAVAAERGIELSGTVSVESDTAPPRTEIEYRDGFRAPASFLPVVRGHLSAHLLDLPLAERELDLHFDRPKFPLWPDSTVHCEPEATNDETIRRRLGMIVENHPDLRAGTLPARRYRAAVWLFISPTGEVERVKVRERTGDFWFDDQLDDVARAMRFEPASLNGVPIGVWVTRNVTFDVRAGTRREVRPPPGTPPR